MSNNIITAAQAYELTSLISATEQGIASRVLAKTMGGNLTLFAFDEKQALAKHTAPFDAVVLVLEGELELIIGNETVNAKSGTVVRMPANIPHSIKANKAAKMLLTILQEAI